MHCCFAARSAVEVLQTGSVDLTHQLKEVQKPKVREVAVQYRCDCVLDLLNDYRMLLESLSLTRSLQTRKEW